MKLHENENVIWKKSWTKSFTFLCPAMVSAIVSLWFASATSRLFKIKIWVMLRLHESRNYMKVKMSFKGNSLNSILIMFMARLSHDVHEYLLMAHLDHIVNYRNESQTKTSWKSKLHENENIWIIFFKPNLWHIYCPSRSCHFWMPSYDPSRPRR